MAERVKTIAVDFDGVIHRYSRGWHDGTIYDPPMPGALDGLRQFMGLYAVYIQTSRSPRPVAEWLAGHGIEACVEEGIAAPMRFWTERDRLLVTNRKLPAIAYLDDRAVRFTSWGQALRELLPDRSYDAQHERVIQALIDAWPDLADDAVYVDQVAHVALSAIEEHRG